jgi:hypothetical protein
MPTTIVGQNGAQIKQNTQIAVSGCRPVTIIKRKLSGRRVIIAFKLTRAGTVTVSGTGIQRYRKHLSAGVHQIGVPLTSAARTLRARRRKIAITVALGAGRRAARARTTLKL